MNTVPALKAMVAEYRERDAGPETIFTTNSDDLSPANIAP